MSAGKKAALMGVSHLSVWMLQDERVFCTAGMSVPKRHTVLKLGNSAVAAESQFHVLSDAMV